MFADTEQKIIERLRARLPAGTTVEPLRELERVPQLRQRAPAAWVIYDGYNLGDKVSPNAAVQQVVQQWYIVVADKSARGNGDVADARDRVSDLAEAVLAALLGYHLGAGKYLHLAEAPGPEYDAGYAHLPLAFTCAATFKGSP